MAELEFQGFFMCFFLVEKLKALKGILKTWNWEVFGKVEVRKSFALRIISYWMIKRRTTC